MGLFSGCLLACDIDGTLLVNGQISDRNIEKIELFMQEGGAFSLATGRSVGAVKMVLRKLKKISPSVVANGCMIYDYSNKNTLYELSIPESDYHIVKEVIEFDKSVGVEAHSGNLVLVINESKETHEHQIYEELEPTYVLYEEALKYKWNKVVYLFNDEKHREDVKQFIKRKKSNCCFMDTSAELLNRKRFYYEQLPIGISKASALEKLCEILDIKKGCLFAIGDYYNDLEMLNKADISAVPVESPEDIKSVADFVAGSCENGAVADFIDYLIRYRKDANNGRCN